jgi:hypothetical protein
MNMLQLVQEFCGRRGLPVPTGVQSSTNAQVIQIKGMLNTFCEDLVTRKAWQENTIETTFVSTAAEDQGSILTICPYGFEGIVLETMFDRTQRVPLYGGLNASEWQVRKALQITGPQYQFRLRQNRLMFSPALPASHTIAFEYQSSYFVQANETSPPAPYKAYWTFDTDSCTLGDQLPLMFMAWKWPALKGFDYAEEFAAYERMLAAKLARNASPPVVDMSGTTQDLRPGIWVPSGNWMVP